MDMLLYKITLILRD